jgi:predicted CopG family antitoxin
MAERMVRTQILLEPNQHEELAEIAHREGRSVSDLVREIIREQLEQRRRMRDAEVKRHLDALDRIREHREAILARRGGKPLEKDVVEVINQMREERDAEILGNTIVARD